MNVTSKTETITELMPGVVPDAETSLRRFVSDFTENKVAVGALMVFVGIVFVAIFAPLISTQNPYDLAEIDIIGDISLPSIQDKTKNWKTGFIRVDDVNCGIKVLSGEPYCTGGCHGVFLDWLYMIKDRKAKLWKKLPSWTVVIGKYRGDVTAERVLIVGSCSEVQGRLNAKRIRRIKGCPPKHKDLVLWILLRRFPKATWKRSGVRVADRLSLFVGWRFTCTRER